MIQKKVKLSGLSLREFVMRCITGKDIHVKQGGRDVVIELKRIGNNLNQLTYNVNTGQITDCSRQLESVREQILEVRRTWQ